MKIILLTSIIYIMMCSCDNKNSDFQNPSAEETKELSDASLEIRDMLSKNIIIAHRGSTYWTPEETEPAFRWARNMGADYLELDLQMTKDSVLVAMHDDDLLRTSNVKDIFPEVDTPTTKDFTLKELRELDFGTWFNIKNPDRARENFVNTKILTFHDVVMIAEGYHIKKNKNGEPIKKIVDGVWSGQYEHELDPKDNKNRPGVYAETKKLHLEKLLAKELKQYGWLITDNPKQIKTYNGKIAYANTNARFILQTFHRESIAKLNEYLPGVPKCLLIWEPDMRENSEIKNVDSIKAIIKKNYVETINYCVDNNVEIIGSSISGMPNNYGELSSPWMIDLIHKSGMIIHPYTFDTSEDFNRYIVDGVFTNRTDLALLFYKREKENKSKTILMELGY